MSNNPTNSCRLREQIDHDLRHQGLFLDEVSKMMVAHNWSH